MRERCNTMSKITCFIHVTCYKQSTFKVITVIKSTQQVDNLNRLAKNYKEQKILYISGYVENAHIVSETAG